LVRQIRVLRHHIAQCRDTLDDRLGAEAALADQRQTRAARAQLGVQLCPYVEEQRLIFARFDRADADEVRRVGARRDWVVTGQTNPERRNGNGNSARSEMLGKRVGRRRGVDDDRIGEPGGRGDPLPVPVRLARAGQTRKVDRDQIVDQDDKPRAGRGLEAGDRIRTVEILV
jgi:hypothetical protein